VVAALERQSTRPCALVDERGVEVPLMFDAAGRLVGVGSGTSASLLKPTYDRHGHLLSEERSSKTSTTSYRYRYDDSGRVIESTASEGSTIDIRGRYTYHGSRLSGFTEHAACCGDYNATVRYDRSGRLTQVSATGHPPLTIELTYDTAGRLASVQRVAPSPRTVELGYEGDRLSQLVLDQTYAVRYACKGK
jgi:YD repeat-containing protein